MSDVTREIERQRRLDRDRGVHLGILAARIRVVALAQRATVEGEVGAREALRAGLIDLAAVAEALADDLGPPGPPEGLRRG